MELAAGVYVVDISVVGNEDCTFGSCRGTNFVVEAGLRSSGRELLVNEIASEWSGKALLEVGDDRSSVAPGNVPIQVTAESAGEWTIEVQSVSALPAVAAPATLTGYGSDVQLVQITPGAYVVDISVAGNEDCTFGSCSETNFVVKAGTSSSGSELLTNEIASEWSGKALLEVGDDRSAVAPGNVPIQVAAASLGEWTIEVRSVSALSAATVPATLTGSGTDVQLVQLAEDVYVVDINVASNEDCNFGSCSETNFVVKAGTSSSGSELLANEIASEWSGKALLEVGDNWSSVTPGNAPIQVAAGSAGRWTIEVQSVSALPAVTAPATLTGSGTDVQLVQLRPGAYVVDISVAGNEDCNFGSCSETNFVVKAGASSSGSELLVNEIASEWSGKALLEVGDDWSAVAPGNVPIQVDAGSAGRWTITITAAE